MEMGQREGNLKNVNATNNKSCGCYNQNKFS